ncbi:FtsK/SpoIIIE domain-containing protein [Myceligenerans crystallogenes]|uniref:FtsK/SpoIIIE domain-containing protein n=1 Tax=Myceligenerans crystallogenes TaxID=316335 RepID=A0ABN2NGC9_9MICO
MSNGNEKRLPDDGELFAMVYGAAEVGRDARPASGGAGVPSSDDGMPGADAVAGEDNALSGEVIPAPAGPAEVEARAPRVIRQRGTGEPLRVLPEWATSWDVFLPAMRRHTAYLASWTAHHGLRLPFDYAPKFLGRSMVGLAVCTRGLVRWVLDSDQKATRKLLVEGVRGTAEYRALRKEYREQVRARLAGLTAGGVLLGVAGVTLYGALGPDGFQLAAAGAGAAALTAFGIVGTRKVDKPIASEHSTKVPALTVDVVTDALMRLELSGQRGEVKRGNAEIKVLRIFPATGGTEIHVDLPAGATAADVVKSKDKLAGALRRPIDCVWPEGNPKAHPSRLNLYIADKALSERGVVPFKYRRRGVTNVFEEFEIGHDQRGRGVSVSLMYNNGLVGGLPGMGKTFVLRVFMVGAALDPRTELHIHELKGTGDLLPFEPIAHVCRSGDDPDDIAALLTDLKGIQAEMRRRAKIIRTLPRSVVTESKVTDELAAVGNPHGFKPLMLVIDESQLAFNDPTHGKEITALVEDIERRGRALAIMVWLATQRPNKDAIPTSISALISLRLCLRVGDQTTNDMVLGTSMYQAGHRATEFSGEDKGVALLAGEKSDPQLVRGAYIDGATTDQIVERARAHREELGLLTGAAAGEEPADVDHSTILDHLLAVWPENDPDWPNGKVWSDELAARLAEHKPALYDGWTGPQVNAAVKNHGIEAKGVKHKDAGGIPRNRAGLTRTDLAAAAADEAALPEFDTLARPDESEED